MGIGSSSQDCDSAIILRISSRVVGASRVSGSPPMCFSDSSDFVRRNR